MLAYLIGLLLVGLIVGGLARLFVPGPDPMGIGATILIGIAGSYIAGVLVWTFHGRGGAGFVLSVLCSMGLVYVARRSRAVRLRRYGSLDRYGPVDPYRPVDRYGPGEGLGPADRELRPPRRELRRSRRFW